MLKNLPTSSCLQVCPQHVLGRSLAGHTAEDHTVQQRVATQAIVAVDAAGHLRRLRKLRSYVLMTPDWDTRVVHQNGGLP